MAGGLGGRSHQGTQKEIYNLNVFARKQEQLGQVNKLAFNPGC